MIWPRPKKTPRGDTVEVTPGPRRSPDDTDWLTVMDMTITVAGIIIVFILVMILAMKK